jgi:hypothetical protein
MLAVKAHDAAQNRYASGCVPGSGRDFLNERWVIVPGACFVDAPGHRPKANAIIGRRRQNLGTGSAAQPRLETRLVEHDRHAIVNVSPVLGGQFAVGMTGLAGQNKTSIDGTLTAAVGPFAAMRPGSISDQRGGFGDLYPLASLRWNSGLYNFMTYMTGDIPVGLYDSSNLANLGIGHGAIDGGVGYTYFNPQTGKELSVVTGLTGNFKNTVPLEAVSYRRRRLCLQATYRRQRSCADIGTQRIAGGRSRHI